MQIARALVTLSASILFALGSIHSLYTFWGPKLTPRDPALQARMREVSPVISRETTMWKAWIGFNASHALGALLFGLVYGYLAIAQPAVLFRSVFLLAVGFCLLLSYLVLGKTYWFRVPFTGILLAFVSYAIGLGASIAAS
ncbi:MAG TPA: hypothetical protein VGK45_13260 [Thermoanaerobaculia bacterium]|jgi:ABC-type multidrug transport system fused ATPase/permease subunit